MRLQKPPFRSMSGRQNDSPWRNGSRSSASGMKELEAQERSVRDRILICVEQMNALINESQLNQESYRLSKGSSAAGRGNPADTGEKGKRAGQSGALDQQIQAMTEEARQGGRDLGPGTSGAGRGNGIPESL